MAKFQVFKHNQIVMAQFGIYSCRMKPLNEFFKSFGAYYEMMFLFGCVLTSLMFILTHLSEKSLALEISCTIIGQSQATAMFVAAGFQLNKIMTLHSCLQELVNEGCIKY